MSKTVWKGGTLTAPVPPCMVTCGEGENANIITIAWTGITNTVPPKTYISVRPTRYSHGIISESREFCINLTPASLIKAADFCGIYTGRKVNKFERCKLHKAEASEVRCPVIAESPLSLECRVTDIIPLGSHDMFLADIVAIDVDDSLLDENGKLCLERAELAAFAHGEYFELGKKIGTFGFSAKKKKKSPQKKNKK
ncbi:MAG: flavin reductase family protein [Ruminococcaceae bacterium]|nr:flavin reductase family protein [Oscillospiraceae bacterium]